MRHERVKAEAHSREVTAISAYNTALAQGDSSAIETGYDSSAIETGSSSDEVLVHRIIDKFTRDSPSFVGLESANTITTKAGTGNYSTTFNTRDDPKYMQGNHP
jgi:hypothetical protein